MSGYITSGERGIVQLISGPVPRSLHGIGNTVDVRWYDANDITQEFARHFYVAFSIRPDVRYLVDLRFENVAGLTDNRFDRFELGLLCPCTFASWTVPLTSDLRDRALAMTYETFPDFLACLFPNDELIFTPRTRISPGAAPRGTKAAVRKSDD
jgi:hypothetical protein